MGRERSQGEGVENGVPQCARPSPGWRACVAAPYSPELAPRSQRKALEGQPCPVGTQELLLCDLHLRPPHSQLGGQRTGERQRRRGPGLTRQNFTVHAGQERQT